MTARVVLASNLLTRPCPARLSLPDVCERTGDDRCSLCSGSGTVLRSALVLGSDDYEMTVPCPVLSNEPALVARGDHAHDEWTPPCLACHGTRRVPAPVGVYENVSIEEHRAGFRATNCFADGTSQTFERPERFLPLAVAGSAHLIPWEKVEVSHVHKAPHRLVDGADGELLRLYLPPDLYDSLRGRGPVLYLTGIEAT